MTILMVGGGGREHALIRKLKESPKVDKVYCAPGNGGISRDAACRNVAACDIDGMVALAKEIQADLVFVAPDDPLAAGMVDAMESNGFRAFGPRANAAVIESSKSFSKDMMKRFGIPTAAYEVFTDADQASDYIRSRGEYPVVIKADGLALGKGVIIAENEADALRAVDEMMRGGAFGDSGKKVVIEEYLTGPEVSVLSFTDGKTIVPMISSMDHKRALDGDQGLNTGGMGTVAPNPFYTPEIAAQCMDQIFLPTVRAMNALGRPFKGCLYFGLMLTEKGPRVIEYNARFGDPETQVVLPLLETPLIDIVEAVVDGRLGEIDVKFSTDSCACVVMASGGYPGSYAKGLEITGLDADGQLPGATVYHAGTAYSGTCFRTAGGRVLGVTARAATLDGALEQAYSAVERIHFDGAHYRTDIGRKRFTRS